MRGVNAGVALCAPSTSRSASRIAFAVCEKRSFFQPLARARAHAATVTAASLSSDADAVEPWERFYLAHSKSGAKGHDVAAFKDRHYLRKVFSELVDDEARAAPETFRPALVPEDLGDVDDAHSIDVMELGCGVGNSVFPLLRANLNMRVVAVDCSQTAIASLKANPEFDSRRLRTAVVDASKVDSLKGFVEDASLDAVTAVFFFSALTEDGLRNATAEIARTLRSGGILLFRDYARGDVKENEESEFVPGSKAGDERTYRRSDGTLAVFFEEDELANVFDEFGLKGECEIVEHVITNRKLGISMTRKFVQGRFVKKQ
jgi:methyltransferase-like protein 6